MDYIFQVGKKVQQGCVLKKFRIGNPVEVTADCLEVARQTAASKIIVRSASYNPKRGWRNPSGSYDLWLKSEAEGHDYGSDQFFWYYNQVTTLQ